MQVDVRPIPKRRRYVKPATRTAEGLRTESLSENVPSLGSSRVSNCEMKEWRTDGKDVEMR